MCTLCRRSCSHKRSSCLVLQHLSVLIMKRRLMPIKQDQSNYTSNYYSFSSINSVYANGSLHKSYFNPYERFSHVIVDSSNLEYSNLELSCALKRNPFNVDKANDLVLKMTQTIEQTTKNTINLHIRRKENIDNFIITIR